MVSNRVGVMSTPGRTYSLMKPTRVTHQALLLDQGLNIVVVFAHLGPLQAELCNSLHQWQNIKVLGFKGASERRRIEGLSEREGFGGESTQGILKDGERREF